MAENHGIADKYAIDPSAFARTLRDQRATQMKGGLYHLTQVLMAFNTNRIEGSRVDEEQTRNIYETRTVADEMLDRVGDPITAETMKDYHRILKRGTADARRPSFAVGNWRRLATMVGGRPTARPDQVESAVQDLLTRKPDEMSFDDIVAFHHDFERIHPFQDGNGRVGRILMFQQCLSNGIMPFIVLDEQKGFYYRGLSMYEDEPGYLRDTLRAMQDDYYARFKDFVEFER